MEKVILEVNGMSCEHCVKAIKNSLSEIDGIEKVDISLEEGTVTVEYDTSKVEIENIKNIIEDAGYEVV
jgi:copper chaperone